MDYNTRYKLAAKLISKGYLIHCTPSDFDKFDPQFIKGGGRGREGYGFYFSDMPYKPVEYGSNMKIIKKDDFNFLPLTQEIDLSWFDSSEIDIDIAKLEDQMNYVRNIREFNYLDSEIKKLKDKREELYPDRDLLSYVKLGIEYGAKNYGALDQYILNPTVNLPKLTKVYMSKGYDGGYYDGIYTVWNFEKLNNRLITLSDEEINEILSENKKKRIIITEDQFKRLILR